MTIDGATKLFPGITYGVSDTSDGNMSFTWGPTEEVIRNREVFLRGKGLKLEDCAVMSLQHEEKIVIVGRDSLEKNVFASSEGIIAEALITKEKGLTLFLMTADCLPIAYYDLKREIVALAHLGWKPTEKKLAAKVVREMVEKFETDPRDVIVLIGPGIHKDSYVFMNPQQKQFAEWQPFLEETPSGETKIDLVGFNRDQLLRLGVLPRNIVIDPNDTAQSPRFYSHCRSLRTSEPEGRFATIIGLK